MLCRLKKYINRNRIGCGAQVEFVMSLSEIRHLAFTTLAKGPRETSCPAWMRGNLENCWAKLGGPIQEERSNETRKKTFTVSRPNSGPSKLSHGKKRHNRVSKKLNTALLA